MADEKPYFRQQFLKDGDPKTIHVIDSRFNNDIMVINEDQFDKKIHKRCNEHGQLVDARGAILPDQFAKTQLAKEEKQE